MLQVNFNLRDKKAATKTAIVMKVNFGGRTYKSSTRLSINPKAWNSKKQAAKEQIEFPESRVINNRLAELEASARKIIEEISTQGKSVGNELFTEKLFGEFKPTIPEEQRTFWDWFEEFLDMKLKSGVRKDVIKDYNSSLRKHLLQFEIWFQSPLSIESFRNRPGSAGTAFIEYLTYYASPVIRSKSQPLDQFLAERKPPKRKINPNINEEGDASKGLALNTVGKLTKNIKVFLNWCFNTEIVPPFSLKHLETAREDIDRVYLTEEELLRIENLTLENLKLDSIRDLLLFGCETGLRYGDLSNLKREHFEEDRLYKITSKSKTPVQIPLSARAKKILLKYDYELPSYKKPATFNKGIREICKIVGLVDRVAIRVTRKDRTIEEWKPKWEFISSHVCRRTFCTLKYLKGNGSSGYNDF
jgi:integrase